LQEFLRIFKNVAQFIALCSQHFRSQLRRHLDSRHRSIFRNESNFVDLDARITGQRGLQLFR
jgi:hypothetical protein